MDSSDGAIVGTETKKVIETFVSSSTGLELQSGQDGHFTILQRVDGKALSFAHSRIEEVLERHDTEGKAFLQVNFLDGKKILLTEKLIGFKPVATNGLDLKKLPKVVTTPDLMSVVEAIEESLSSTRPRFEEIEVLRKVFDSVLLGAQEVGFDLEAERVWLSCIATSRASA